MIAYLTGDCRTLIDTLPPQSVQCIVTSPRYWRLRRYTDSIDEIGQEATPAAYVAALADVFARCWRVLRDEHHAPMPRALAERCIRAGSRPGDTVLDPFAGSGTTGRAALALQRRAILIDLGYAELQQRRTDGVQVELDL